MSYSGWRAAEIHLPSWYALVWTAKSSLNILTPASVAVTVLMLGYIALIVLSASTNPGAYIAYR
jgi:hypothetical protein